MSQVNLKRFYRIKTSAVLGLKLELENFCRHFSNKYVNF